MSIRNILLVLLFGGVTGTLLLREQQRGTLEPFDRAHREFLKANPDSSESHRPVPSPTVVLARMDDIDQPNKVFAGWPLTPADYEIILQGLPGYEPKTVALSAPLPAGSPLPALESAAKGVPGLLVSVQTSAIAGDGAKDLPLGLPVLTVRGSIAAVPVFASLNLAALPGIAGVERIDFAPTECRLTVDGDTCRVPMLARMGEKVVPSLALRALMQWAQVSPDALKIQMGVAITGGTRLRIPIDEGGFFRYYLSLAPQVPSVNVDEFVLTRPAPGAPPAPGTPATTAAEKTKGSLLWVGDDDKASRRFKLPNGSPVSPAELTARAIAAIQTGAFMLPLDYRQQWLPPAAALLFCLWFAHWRKTWLWLGATLAATLLAAASLYLYRARQEWMPIGPSLGIIAANTLLAFILPPVPRRGKPANIPGARTRTRTLTRQQSAATNPGPTPVPAKDAPRLGPAQALDPCTDPIIAKHKSSPSHKPNSGRKKKKKKHRR